MSGQGGAGPPLLAVAVDDLRYPDGTRALSGIRFAIQAGEVCAVVGANGSGKTTLLRLLAGHGPRCRGEVRLEGVELGRIPGDDLRRTVGLVPQDPDDQLLAHTVREDVAFGPRNLGLGEEEVARRVESALAAVGAEALATREVHHLSHGEKKRVCIAGLLAMGHRLLLLDEPTAGLDPEGEARMVDLVLRLNRAQGVTVLLATHAVDLVPLLAGRVLVLEGGRLVRVGTPREVLAPAQQLPALRLRLPYVTEVFRGAGDDAGAVLPLTVEEARRELARRTGRERS